MIKNENIKLALINKVVNKKGQEIQCIYKWFEDYDRKIQEHSRCVRMGKVCHHNIMQLDAEAEEKKSRLAQINTNS